MQTLFGFRKIMLVGAVSITGLLLNGCAASSPKYVGSIGSSPASKQQRTLDNREINTIIKSLQNDAKKQQKIINGLVR